MNQHAATCGLYSDDAARLRPLTEKAVTCKVTPCLQSTNNIIVLNAFMPHRLLHHFSVGTIINSVNKLHDQSHIPQRSAHEATRQRNVSRRVLLQRHLLCGRRWWRWITNPFGRLNVQKLQIWDYKHFGEVGFVTASPGTTSRGCRSVNHLHYFADACQADAYFMTTALQFKGIMPIRRPPFHA